MSENKSRLHITQTIAVEGKYDKIALENITDAMIVDVGGFRVFRDAQTVSLLRRLAACRGVIILTDSDTSGFKIRTYLNSVLEKNKKNVFNAYIPDIYGKERRKQTFSKEGKLGVEGMGRETLELSIRRCMEEHTAQDTENKHDEITKLMLYEDGLYGKPDSHTKRERLCAALGLPKKLSSNRLPAVISSLIDNEEYKQLILRINSEE